MIVTRCVLCGAENSDDVALCRHHTVGDQEWAAVNRLFCDFVHRGIEPEYPETSEDIEPYLLTAVESESETMAVA